MTRDRRVSVRRGVSTFFFFFFQAEDGIRDYKVTGVQTCALPICGDPGPQQAAGLADEGGAAGRAAGPRAARDPHATQDGLPGSRGSLVSRQVLAGGGRIRAGAASPRARAIPGSVPQAPRGTAPGADVGARPAPLAPCE